MHFIMTQGSSTYSQAENICYEYWKGSLLTWMRDEDSSEAPPTFNTANKE